MLEEPSGQPVEVATFSLRKEGKKAREVSAATGVPSLRLSTLIMDTLVRFCLQYILWSNQVLLYVLVVPGTRALE